MCYDNPHIFMKTKIGNLLHKLLFLLTLLSVALVLFILYRHRILPTKYRLVLSGVLAIVCLLIAFMVFREKKSTTLIVVSCLLMVVLISGSLFGYGYIAEGLQTYHLISGEKREENYAFSLVVRQDSPINGVEDIVGKNVEAAIDRDELNVQAFTEKISQEYEQKLNLIEGQDYGQMALNLLERDSEIMLLNEAYRPMLEEQYPHFSDTTKALVTAYIQGEAVQHMEADDVRPYSGFNLYVSGIDTYGEISTVSRSDVNLIITVNPEDKKILITSIPRDTYMRISGGGNGEFDKLTHSGLYGIGNTVESVENLFEIDINYYVRVNFSSLVELVDLLGGIEANNEIPFTRKYYFDKGPIYLDGEKALIFSRERYSFAEGDVMRGQNQIRVIEGIMKKAMSPSILLNYNEFLDVVEKSMETNLPLSKITELVNIQLDYGGDWTFEELQLQGEGTRDLPSYAMPGYVQYVSVPDEDSIQEIHQRINAIAK